MPIPSSLLFGAVPNEIVDDPLIHALAGESGNERMPQSMEAFHFLPLRALQSTLEVVVSFVFRQRANARSSADAN